MGRRSLGWLLTASAVLLAACGAPPPPAKTPDVLRSSVDTPVAKLMPAAHDTVHAYETKDLIAGTSGVLMLRTNVTGPRTMELVGAKTQRLRFDDRGVLREPEGTYLLRTPLAVGESWPGGPNASLSIVKTDLAITVIAGSFKGCLEVVDKRVGAISGTIRTVYCPDVGMVLVETEGKSGQGEVHERVELKSYGKALDISKPGATPLARRRGQRSRRGQRRAPSARTVTARVVA